MSTSLLVTKMQAYARSIGDERIWGGTKLRDSFGYDIPSDQTGECWAISAHPRGTSAVRNGPFSGKTLDRLWKEHPELFGHPKEDAFPLLTKILDANMDLSVQVHPNDGYANLHENGELGKTECWYILDCPKGAELILGHHAKTKEDFVRLIQNSERISLYKQLYTKIYHYMTDTRGLDNLLWVYAPDANRDFKTDFYPGSSYVDIVGLNAYFSDAYAISGYDELVSLNKPFAFTEVGPSVTNGSLDYASFINAIRQKYPKTTYFLTWDEQWSPAANKGASSLYNNSWTLNKGEMWNGGSLTPITE
ncbi:mannose-6-phosphate isomerase, class I [Pseudomonas sp. ISL-88]|uniref:mannose-6-phosphate isomerase, class I n=1 Tax=Pseudomonas sp. ISL-88 TaxID=2819169 RepID=UPI001BED20BA|nr:mannose-6-phosphate isomerase, class I [Pseudomonas sp. ISL-88]